MPVETERTAYDLLIDGDLVPAASSDRFDTVDPATGEPFAQVARGTAADIDAAVEAARQALPEWRSMPPQERGRLLTALAERIRDEKSRLAELETRDNGKPRSSQRP